MKFRVFILVIPMILLAFPIAASSTDTKIYTDMEWAYTLEFPGHLQVYNEGDGSVSFLNRDDVEVVRVDCYYDEPTRGHSPLGGAVEGILEILDYSYDDWELLSEGYQETWQEYQAGEIWYSTFDGDIWWQECDYIIEADGIVYLVSMMWPEEDMGDYWDDFYQIVYSFAIL
jgi:hypothetical protein